MHAGGSVIRNRTSHWCNRAACCSLIFCCLVPSCTVPDRKADGTPATLSAVENLPPGIRFFREQAGIEFPDSVGEVRFFQRGLEAFGLFTIDQADIRTLVSRSPFSGAKFYSSWHQIHDSDGPFWWQPETETAFETSNVILPSGRAVFIQINDSGTGRRTFYLYFTNI
jgi:hypothetical protein